MYLYNLIYMYDYFDDIIIVCKRIRSKFDGILIIKIRCNYIMFFREFFWDDNKKISLYNVKIFIVDLLKLVNLK